MTLPPAVTALASRGLQSDLNALALALAQGGREAGGRLCGKVCPPCTQPTGPPAELQDTAGGSGWDTVH